jgi:type II secretory pathway pseudopilin PulG
VSMRGFTLLETLLAVSLIFVLTGIGAPVYYSFQSRNDLDAAASAAAESYRRAQALAQASDGDSPWGLRVQDSSIVIFKGESYAARDAGADEAYAMPSSIVAGGASEIVFSKFDGMPSAPGALTLTSTPLGESRTVTVNAKGMVSF